MVSQLYYNIVIIIIVQPSQHIDSLCLPLHFLLIQPASIEY